MERNARNNMREINRLQRYLHRSRDRCLGNCSNVLLLAHELSACEYIFKHCSFVIDKNRCFVRSIYHCRFTLDFRVARKSIKEREQIIDDSIYSFLG